MTAVGLILHGADIRAVGLNLHGGATGADIFAYMKRFLHLWRS